MVVIICLQITLLRRGQTPKREEDFAGKDVRNGNSCTIGNQSCVGTSPKGTFSAWCTKQSHFITRGTKEDKNRANDLSVPPMPMANIDANWESISHSAALDMRELKDHYLVCFSLPKVTPKELHVRLRGQVLEVTAFTTGESGAIYEVGGGDGRNLRVERHIGGMQGLRRRIQIPGPVLEDPPPTAFVTNGVLRITLPKAKYNENVISDYIIM